MKLDFRTYIAELTGPPLIQPSTFLSPAIGRRVITLIIRDCGHAIVVDRQILSLTTCSHKRDRLAHTPLSPRKIPHASVYCVGSVVAKYDLAPRVPRFSS